MQFFDIRKSNEWFVKYELMISLTELLITEIELEISEIEIRGTGTCIKNFNEWYPKLF